MTVFGIRTLTAKLLGVFIPVVCLSLFGSFVVQELTFFKAQRADLKTRLERLLDVQSSAFVSAHWEYDTDEISALSGELAELPFVASVAVYDKSDAVVVAKGPYDSAPETAAYRAEKPLVYRDGLTVEALGRLVLTVHGREIRSAVIAHTKDSALLLLLLIVALIAGAVLSTRAFITRPLTRLRASMDRAKTDNLREPVRWQSTDELGQVVDAYNDMQARQAEAEAEVKRYQDELEDLVEERTRQLFEAHKAITESVEYAANIQRAALPFDELLGNAFADHFVIWEPRDIVGGDIYWLIPVAGGYVFGVADCTGHGVPGAFVTLLASGALRYAMNDAPNGDPAFVIARMNRFIKEVLSQYTEDSHSNDGLEIGLCWIDSESRTLTYAGARFSLWVGENGALREIKGDKTGIGYIDITLDLELKNHVVRATGETRFYLISDGIVDQIGGQKRRALGKRRLIRALCDNMTAPMGEQFEAIMEMFNAYQGHERRRDDITMVGFRL